MDEEEIRISYETIYEFLRNEKQKDDLQKLPTTFYADAVEYMEEKKKILNNENKDLFTEAELEKARVQINNIRKMIKDLFDRREKKIIILSMNLSRTENAVYDKSVLLDKEREYMISLTRLLKNYRENVIKKVSNGFLPTKLDSSIVNTVTQMHRVDNSNTHKTKPSDAPKQQENSSDPTNKSVRFIHSVPKFIGPDGKVFGPYEPEDMASLPEKIVNILVKKRRAERVDI